MRLPLALAAAVLVWAVPAAAAPTVTEDPATYPPGVAGIHRDWVAPGEEFSVTVDATGYDQAAMVICRFSQPDDAEPVLCWSQIRAAANGTGFRMDSSGGAHPRWEEGWTIGYKVILKDGSHQVSAPTVGGEYYKLTVAPDPETAAKGADAKEASGACLACFAGLWVAALVRRRAPQA